MPIIGYIGTSLLLLSYVLLNIKKRNIYKLFIPVDTIASLILTIHAILLQDIPFIIVNSFVTIMLSLKWKSGNI